MKASCLSVNPPSLLVGGCFLFPVLSVCFQSLCLFSKRSRNNKQNSSWRCFSFLTCLLFTPGAFRGQLTWPTLCLTASPSTAFLLSELTGLATAMPLICFYHTEWKWRSFSLFFHLLSFFSLLPLAVLLVLLQKRKIQLQPAVTCCLSVLSFYLYISVLLFFL